MSSCLLGRGYFDWEFPSSTRRWRPNRVHARADVAQRQAAKRVVLTQMSNDMLPRLGDSEFDCAVGGMVIDV